MNDGFVSRRSGFQGMDVENSAMRSQKSPYSRSQNVGGSFSRENSFGNGGTNLKPQLTERLINVQDAFLNYVRRNKIQVTMFLMNGVKIIGFVSCFDRETILIKREDYAQLIYKHAVSTICPHKAINLFEWSTANKKELDLDDDLGALTKISEEMKDHV